MKNILDSLIGFVSPKVAFRREQYRNALGVIRKYEGASKGRRTDSWEARGTSANAEISLAISTLRDRSRDFGRNNPYARNANRVITNNTVGKGIRLTYPKLASQNLKDYWWKWAETKAIDFEGRVTLYGLQRLVMRTVAESGEAIVLRRRYSKGILPIQIQVVEGDYLDHTRNEEQLYGGGYIMQGVEFDSEGRRVAYYLWDRHPSDAFNNKVRRVPAEDVLHVYEALRPGQVRGVPFGTSAMIRLRDFDEYEDAELIRKKIAACFSVFVTDPNGDPSSSSDIDRLEKVEPGIVEYLEPGKEVTFAAPPAAEGYEEYSRKILQAISGGYGITYEALTNDYSNVNFSSGRMGWIEMHRNVEGWQTEMLVPQFCDPVWAWFLEAYFLKTGEKVDFPAEWTPPRREMIDPVKETEGVVKAIRGGIKPWQEAVREQGYDPDVVIEQLKEDKEAFDEAGLQLECDIRFDKGKQVSGNGDNNNNDEESKN